MKFFREPYNNWEIEFVYSPFFEMLCSLHVLYKSDHHIRRLEWVQSLRESMNGHLLENLDYFGEHYFEWCSAMDFCGVSDSINGFSIIEAFEYIASMDIRNFVHVMLNKQITQYNINRILAGEKTTFPKNITKEQKYFLQSPEKIRSKFISCLKEYYYTHFQEELKDIEPLLVRTVKRHKIYSEKMDFLDYLKTLHSRIEISNDAFHFHKYTRFDVPFKNIKKIIIKISSFIDPHLLIGIEDSGDLELTIRANYGDKDLHEIPIDFHKVMKALAESTRLKILKSIYSKPECTQNLAEDLGLTEACISKHLKVLYAAGLISRQRQGNFIFYFIDCMQIDKIPMDLYQYLDA